MLSNFDLDLKRIINNALDALVNLEQKEQADDEMGVNELSLRRASDVIMAARQHQKSAYKRNAASSVTSSSVMGNVKKEDLLASEIKELEKILELADSKDILANVADSSSTTDTTKDDEILMNRALTNQARKDKLMNIEEQQKQSSSSSTVSSEKKEISSSLTKKSKSEESSNTAFPAPREEKASVVIDNENIRDLVDLVVRAIDSEARREVKNAGKKNKASIHHENEAVVAKAFKKESSVSSEDATTEDELRKKEIQKKDDETKTLCNSRKRECVQAKKESPIVVEAKGIKNEVTAAAAAKKKAATDFAERALVKKAVSEKKEKTRAHKKEVKTTSTKAKKTTQSDSMEIREMVNEILDGKSEDEREAFASLLESVFERTKSSDSSVTRNNKKREIPKK